MRIILLLLLSTAAFSQQYTFKKATYHFFVPSIGSGSWSRTIDQNVTVTIDTVNKTVTMPNFQMWETIYRKRNLINGVTQSQTADTSLSIIQPTLTFKIVEPIIRLQGADAMVFPLESKIYAGLIAGEFYLQYSEWNSWIRAVTFDND